MKSIPKRAFAPTETIKFWNGKDRVNIRVENSERRFAWQLEVNGSKSQPYSYYPGILMHKGFCIATNYWEGTFPVFIPFEIKSLTKI